ncbi:unnamed protein product, partial [Medioppia subpectinata]
MSSLNGSNDLIAESYESIVKPNDDKRDYKAIVLTNGLKVLLISDRETDKSAAALTTGVGSMSDPRDVQGLAHFAEHMLFLGTRKYPDDNDYNKYINSNGGYRNAFTANTNTTYIFDISTNYLSGALDRFSQFFVEPLFTESATDREINAVQSEYERDLSMDSWRNYHLDKTLSDPNHDYNKFSIGNIESLKEIPLKNGTNVRQELISFHDRWYSANIMSLVVLGKESIKELEEIVIPLFSVIKHKSGVTLPKWQTNPLTADWLQKQCFVVPIKDYRSLKLSFPITDMSAHYRSKPYRYLGHVIGHEGRGSLLSELKANNWCTSLSAGHTGGRGFGFDFFNINVDLTEDGMNHTDDIIGLIFQYIAMLKTEGIKQWICDEIKQMLEIGFQFKDKSQPYSYVQNLVTTLLLYPIEDVLSLSYLMDEYKPELITQSLNELSADRMRVRVVGKQFESIADRTERWFGTKYSLQDIPPEKIQLWLNIGLNDRLALPPPNDFIPYNLNVKPIEDNNQTEPQIIRNTEFSRVWYLQETEFKQPKGYYSFRLTNPLVSDNPFNKNTAELFTRLFWDSVNEYLYAAKLAGLYFSLRLGLTGITFYFCGYNDKLSKLIVTIMDQLVAFKIDDKKFVVFKEIYVRNLKNRHANTMNQLLSNHMYDITADRVWTDEELIQTVDDLTVSNVSQFKDQFLSRFHIEAFIYGNVLKSEAIDVCDAFEHKFKSQLKTKPIAFSQHFLNREIHLTEGSDYVFESKTSLHKTNGIKIYYQIGVRDTKTNGLLGLLQQILKQPFSDKLRTKQQLGYVVRAYIGGDNGVCGMNFLIESDYKPSFLNERIEAYIQWIHKYIEDMNETDFETQRQALITRKLVKSKNFWEKHSKFYCEIMSKEINFNRQEIEVKAIKELTKQNIIDFLKVPNRVNCEHMLFLGTKKYPDDDDYHKYITSNGGYCNAFTAGTNTTYIFDISTDYLSGALDRFSQFFVEPLFTESATDREINAVQSEYERGLSSDAWRNYHLDKTLSDPNHDYNKFSTGNIESLKLIPLKNGTNVRQELLSFHDRWYSANIMSLVVLGKESIKELEEIVIPLFSVIKHKSGVTLPKWQTNPLTADWLQKQCFVVPVKDLRTLTLVFPTPDMSDHYRSKPYRYLGHVIGHEGRGSLLSELKARNWCTEGPKQWVYNELKQMLEINFQCEEKSQPISYVQHLVHTLLLYPIEDVLRVSYRMDEYKPELTTEVLNELNADRMRVRVVGKKYESIADQTERWYGTKYSFQDIPPEKTKLWLNIGLNDRLALPPPNDFIPYNLNVKPIEDNNQTEPQIIRNNEFSRVWYLQDFEYRKPKAYYAFKLT